MYEDEIFKAICRIFKAYSLEYLTDPLFITIEDVTIRKIVIDKPFTTVIIEAKTEDEFARYTSEHIGVARCCSKDVFNKDIGIKIALHRAIRAAAGLTHEKVIIPEYEDN